MSPPTEEARCFRCSIAGRPLFRRGPFGVVRCPRCRQVFISPRPTEDAARALYDDPAYYEAASGGVYGTRLAQALQRTWARGRLDLVEGALGRPRGARLFEIGCAYGLFLEAARERGFEVTGLEYSAVAAERVRAAMGVPVLHGPLERHDVPEGSFDVVCFWDVIEHVRDPGSFLARVRDTVRPGGVVAFACPSFASIPARVFRSRWWTLRPTEHLWHFTPATLRAAFGDAGLPLERIVRSPLARANLSRTDSVVGLARRPA